MSAAHPRAVQTAAKRPGRKAGPSYFPEQPGPLSSLDLVLPACGPSHEDNLGSSSFPQACQAINPVEKWLQIRVLLRACLFLDNFVSPCQGENGLWFVALPKGSVALLKSTDAIFRWLTIGWTVFRLLLGLLVSKMGMRSLSCQPAGYRCKAPGAS